MPRATTGLVHHKRQRKVLREAKGYIGGASTLYRTAKDARRRALQHSFEHRKLKKRDMRGLWITRINAAARICGISYSKLIAAMDKANVQINRKILADIAVTDINAFRAIVDQVK
ncbi:MAG TPA: 50S ribosomal protein L20 [Spirochaetota bacterium]|nr:50S ribosomal protein L20 [Spirochaetota bacterium]